MLAQNELQIITMCCLLPGMAIPLLGVGLTLLIISWRMKQRSLKIIGAVLLGLGVAVAIAWLIANSFPVSAW